MKNGTAVFFVVTASFALLLAACQGTGGSEAARSGADGSSTGFLKTDYEPLNKWLDERFDIDYENMTVNLVFDQEPLDHIYYETTNLPTKPNPLNYSAVDVSRREILHKVARHWKLKMSLIMDASGNPTSVRVEG